MIKISNYSFTWRQIRSVSMRCVFITFILYAIVFIIYSQQNSWQWVKAARDASHLIPLLILLSLSIIGYARDRKKLRSKTIQSLIDRSICPHCKYLMNGLPVGDDGLTTCPECGIAWKLTNNIKMPFKNKVGTYRWEFIIIILLGIFFIVRGIYLGTPFFSEAGALLVVLVVVNIILIIKTIFPKSYFLSQNNHHDIKPGVCPACDALMEDNMMDEDGITTCPKCGAVWRLTDGLCRV